MSKVVKGIGKAIKSIGKGIKKVVSSKIGKALLIAATIYIGGAALGAWNSPFQSINGVLAGGAKSATAEALAAGTTPGATAAGTATAANSVGPLASGYVAPAASTAAAAPIAPNLAAGVTGQAVTGASTTGPLAAGYGAPAAAAETAAAPAAVAAGSSAPAVAQTGVEAAKTVATQAVTEEAPKGIISRLMSGIEPGLDFMSKHPMPTAMMLSAASSAASPDEIDLIREQQNLEEQTAERERLRREKNMNLAGINLNMSPSNKPLTDSSGNAVYGSGGIINRSRGML